MKAIRSKADLAIHGAPPAFSKPPAIRSSRMLDADNVKVRQ
jgi:hypothetical protein